MTTQAPEIIDNAIVRVVNEAGIGADLSQSLIRTFGEPFAQASALIAESRGIVVTDATQVSEMKAARAARLKLRAIRTEAENTRKLLKCDFLAAGKAIDNVAKTIALLIEPEEQRLEEAEKFAERAEAARKARIRAEREEMLRPFGIDTTHYDLGSMPDGTFAGLLENTRLAHEAKIAKAKADEEARLAAERAKQEEDRRIREENARLQREKEAAEAAARAEREKAEAAERIAAQKAAAERAEIERKARAEQARIEAERQKERQAAEAKLAEERTAREKLEREAREREEAERKRKADAERAARKAAAAPDAEKLRTLAKALMSFPLPEMTSDKAKETVNGLRLHLNQIASRLNVTADSLGND